MMNKQTELNLAKNGIHWNNHFLASTHTHLYTHTNKWNTHKILSFHNLPRIHQQEHTCRLNGECNGSCVQCATALLCTVSPISMTVFIDTCPADKDEFQRILGIVNYLALMGRHDLLGPISRLATCVSAPTTHDMTRLHRVVRYIKAHLIEDWYSDLRKV